MRVLLIEDEKKTAAFLSKGLAEAGFKVDTAYDGEIGERKASNEKYDLLIIDVMLPKKDGWAIVSELRKRNVNTPILILTARDSVPDRVKGLELGADDYLVKPFDFSELLARVRSILRRTPAAPRERLKIDDLELDMRRHRALRGGKPLHLTGKEFILLTQLAQAAGEVVSRAQIMEAIWDVNFKTNANIVEVMVRRLRAKVDDPFKVKLVQTIRGVGYALKT